MGSTWQQRNSYLPHDGTLPKYWTGANAFLSKNPSWDGRDVVVGVLDTGVDPGAAGLQYTSDGKVKVVDLVDCTGSGDVDTSTVVQEAEDGTITGLSGRKLSLGDGIRALNPSGSYHIGLKSAFDVFPKLLLRRVKKDRKKKWDEGHRETVAKCRAELAKLEVDAEPKKLPQKKKQEKDEFEAQLAQLKAMERDYNDPGPVLDCIVFHDGKDWRAVVDVTEKGDLSSCVVLENYRIRHRYGTFGDLDLLNFGVNIYDSGNILSLVVDTGYHGTHVAGTIAAYFPDNPELCGIAPGAQIVSLKIGDTRLGSMETHQGLVRAISYLTPCDDGESKEERHHISCDILNMSYGESTAIPDTGRFVELATELVEKHDIMFICSAGNYGPGLTTLNAPGGTTSALTSIGAYVTPEMALQSYSLIDEEFFNEADNQDVESETETYLEPISEIDGEDGSSIGNASTTLEETSSRKSRSIPPERIDDIKGVPAIPYTWCSRGPSMNGALGMNLCAPGGCIAPVPQWTLRKKMLLNGTSMSSPSAAGSVALLVSMLKARKMSYSPIRLQTGLENSAKPLLLKNLSTRGEYLHKRDPFSSGYGSLYLPRAADWLFRGVSIPELDLRFKLSGTGACGEATKGTFLRDLHDSKKPIRTLVNIEATRSSDETPEGRSYLAGLELKINLKTTKTWVKAPKNLILFGGGRVFPIVVNPTTLDSGVAHYAEVQGFIDGLDESLGPSFRYPVSVIKPLELKDPENTPSASFLANTLEFSPGEVKRFFLHVPRGATLCSLKLHAGDTFDSISEEVTHMKRLFVIQAIQIAVDRNPTESKVTYHEPIAPGMIVSKQFCVEEDETLEVCVSQFWSSPGTTYINKIEVVFGGLLPSAGTLHVQQGNLCSDRVYVSNKLATGVQSPILPLCEPKAVLTHLRRAIGPSKAAIRALPDRDRLPGHKQIYELTLTYTFSLSESTEVKVSFPGLSGRLYESVVEGGPFHMIFDANKGLQHSADCYPSAVKLPKCKNYVIRAAIRQDNVNYLEDLKSMDACLLVKLTSEVSLDCYTTQQAALIGIGEKKVKSTPSNDLIQIGNRRQIYFSAPKKSSVPKYAQAGDVLTGYYTVDKWASNLGESGKAGQIVKKYNLSWGLSASMIPSNQSSGSGNNRKDKKAQEDNPKVKEKLDELRGLLKERKLSDFDALFQKVFLENPEHLPALALRLERLEECMAEETNRNVEEILDAADSVSERIVREEFAVVLYASGAEDDPESTAREEAEKKRSILCNALFRKLRAVRRIILTMEDATDAEEKLEACKATYEATYKELQKWNDATKTVVPADEFSILTAERERYRSRYGSGLKALGTYNRSTITKDAREMRRTLLKLLGWEHAIEHEDKWFVINNPKSYTPF